MTDYQQNRLIVYRARIVDIIKQDKQYKSNLILYVACSIVISFGLPYYGDKNGTIMQQLGGGYKKAFIFCLLSCLGMLLLGTIVFHFKDKYRIRKFQKKIADIEKEIKKVN